MNRNYAYAIKMYFFFIFFFIFMNIKSINIKKVYFAIDLLKNFKIRYFLDVIAVCEGTKKSYKNFINDLPKLSEYQVSFLNKKKIKNMKGYPNVLFCSFLRGRSVCASASGRYQFIQKTWNDLEKRFNQYKIFMLFEKDIEDFFYNKEKYYDESINIIYQVKEDILKYKFGPFWQDLYAILLLIDIGVIDDILTNNYHEIFKKTSKIWSTFPVDKHHGTRYSSYINRSQKYSFVLGLIKKYLNRGIF